MSGPIGVARFFIRGDRLLASIFFVLILLYFSGTLDLEQTLGVDIVGPASFPRLLAGLGAVLAVVFLAQSWRNRKDLDDSSESGGIREVVFELAPVAILVVYALAFEPLGFIPATFLYFATTMLILGEGWRKAFAYAAVITVLVFALFYYGLLAPLPMGELIPLEQWLPFIEDLRTWIRD